MNVQKRASYHLTYEEVIQAITLLEEGCSMQYVAGVLGVQLSTISRVAERFRQSGSYRRRPRQGRNRPTTLGYDRFLRLTTLRTRHYTARLLQNKLLAARNV